jgi:hypothetical protein
VQTCTGAPARRVPGAACIFAIIALFSMFYKHMEILLQYDNNSINYQPLANYVYLFLCMETAIVKIIKPGYVLPPGIFT